MKEHTILDVYNSMSSGKKILIVVDSRLNSVSYDLADLDDQSSRAAAILRAYGCKKGNRVLISVRDTLTIWSFFWGALKLGAVPCVLFPGLGLGGLEVRLKAAEVCFWITDIHPSKFVDRIHFPDSLKRVILTGEAAGFENNRMFVRYAKNEWKPEFPRASVDPDDPAFIVFTSGTTGIPKPVVHRHGIAESIVSSMKNVLHANIDDVYWCTAHPAWITGTVYGILGPVLCGISSIQYEGNFHAKRWIPILQDQKVSLWYTAPTALRALMREEPAFFAGYDFSALKQIYSIGEPLSAAVYHWCEQVFSQPIYDTWFQTECGTIRIANQPGEPIIPGWMGKPVSDCTAEILEANPDGIGELALNTGFSSLFKEYYHMPDQTALKFKNGAYLTGDLVTRGSDGYFHFEGRADDVINTSGHLVGPLEIEQVLADNPAVAAAAVVGEPDDLLYEAPAAFIVLLGGQEWSRQLETELKVSVNTCVSSYAVPKHFYVVDNLPQTPSGKINRSELRNLLKSGL